MRQVGKIDAVACVDASEAIGIGHLARSLSLAGALRARGCDPEFWIRGDEFGLERARSAGVRASLVGRAEIPSRNIDLLILDSYAVDGALILRARRHAGIVVVLTDIPGEALPANLLHSAVGGAESWLKGGDDTQLLVGPDYALLPREFEQPLGRSWSDRIGSILVTFGGSDPGGWTFPVLSDLRRILPEARYEVAIGPLYRGEVPASDDRVTVRRGADLRTLMPTVDLAVSAAGQTLFELAATGTPTIAVMVADNQLEHVKSLERLGAVLWSGRAADPDRAGRLAHALARLSGRDARRALGERAREVIDGRGAQRTADAILARVTA